ncbi:MAG: FAD-binding oxidoreductase [Patescibacteria group bacterium]
MLADDLRSLVRGTVATDDASREAASRDASIFQVTPEAVVAPQDSADVQALVRYANEHPGVSLTARAAGTCMSGGPLSSSIVLDMKPGFHAEAVVHGDVATVMPGVLYRDFEKITLAHGLIMPTYPASRELCAIGGMVSNNAGGEKSLTYGQTADYVHSLRAVLSDGNEYELGPLSGDALKAKLAQQDFEGSLYRAMYELVTHNAELITAARPKVSKNSAGYQLWRVWDGETMNLAKVLVGAQGTLGIITEATLSLIKPKPFSRLLVSFIDTIADIPGVVSAIRAHAPESLESYDDKTFMLAFRFMPEFAQLLGARNIISLGLQFIPEAWMLLTHGVPRLVVLAEFSGDTDAEALAPAQAAEQSLRSLGIRTRMTQSANEAKKYWAIRRESFNLLRHHIRGRQTVPFIDDVIVPPERLAEFLPRLTAMLDPYKLTYTLFGHIGDGNFHIIPFMKLQDPKTQTAIKELSSKVYALVKEFGGSITAEHNDGIIRTPFIEEMYGRQVYALFRRTKEIFDPHTIFNPGKKVGGSWQYALDHIQKS